MKHTRSSTLSQFIFSLRTTALLALLCLPSIAAGQQTSIRGVVSDPSGAAVSGAFVTLSDGGQAPRSRTRTAADGTYSFSVLSPGKYELTVEHDGFPAFSKRDIVCSGPEDVRVDVRLALPVAVEKITVTAEKREADVETLASSISVITAGQADEQAMSTVLDIAAQTPNLYITNPGMAMATFASMRGVTAGMTQIPAVGFYVDDVYYSSLDAALFDVERIEVLRGPQGALYGRNSEAGVINVITRKPANSWLGGGEFETGSFNTFGVQANVSGPLVKDKALFNAAVRRSQTDGYFKNRFDESSDGGRTENTDGRGSLLLFPWRRLSLDLKYDLQRRNSPKYANFAPLDGGELRNNVNVDESGNAHNHSDGLSLRSSYSLDGKRLTSVTSWRGERYYAANDIDFSPWDLMALSVERKNSLVTEELRLASGHSDARLKWLGGVFVLSENDDRRHSTWMNFANMGMGAPGERLAQNSSINNLGLAAFGEAAYSVTRRLNATFGLRHDYERKEFSYVQTPSGFMLPLMGYAGGAGNARRGFSAWSPKAALGYALTDRIRLHASASRGFRSGGFNDKDQLGSAFEPEFTWNYEIGVKAAFWRDRLRLSAALFYIDWSRMQVEVPTQGGSSVYIDNAAKATSKGAEVEVTARLVKGLDFTAGLARTGARYGEYRQASTIYDDKRVIDVPDLTLNFALAYRFRGVVAGLSGNRVGKLYFDPANTMSQSYSLLGARVGYEFKKLTAYVYGENLAGDEYVTRAFAMNGVWYGRAGAPRSVGVRLAARF